MSERYAKLLELPDIPLADWIRIPNDGELFRDGTNATREAPMATIDLDEIQRKIEAQQGGCVQPSPSRAPRGLERGLVETLWQLMGSLFGHKWVSSYGAEVDPDNVWAAALYGLDEAAIRKGMRACVDQQLEWPPSAPEFRGLCTGPANHWEHSMVTRADRDWQARALPAPSQQERIDAVAKEHMAKMRAMLRGAA